MTKTPSKDSSIFPAERLTAKGTSGLLGWRAAFLVSFGVLMSLAAAPPGGLALHRHAVSLDPTLSTSTLELTWALVANPFARIVESLPLRTSIQVLLLPSLALAGVLATIFRLASAGGASARSLWVVNFYFLLFTWLIGVGSGGRVYPTGPDVLVLALFLGVGLSLRAKDPGAVRLGGTGIGFLAGSGWVYCLILALVRAFAQLKLRSREAAAILFGLTLNLGLFILLRVRYPHADLVSDRSPFREWLMVWWNGGDLVPWGMAATVFPGVIWILLRAAALLARSGTQRVWNLSAGRTVPIQLALFSLVLIPVGLSMGWGLRQAVHGGGSLSLTQREINLRTLLTKTPPSAELILFPEDFGMFQILRLREETRGALQGRLEPAGDLFNEESWNAEREIADPNAPVRIGFNGMNFARIEGETLRFEPQYLLDNATEVWAASPEFFIANDPTSATGQPTLFFEHRPLTPQRRSDLGIENWSYDGRRIYLYKPRKEAPWSIPEGEWGVDYLGYILAEEFERGAQPFPRRSRETFEGFF